MDSNEKNNEYNSVLDLAYSDIKAELSEEPTIITEQLKETIYLKLKKLNEIFEKKLNDLESGTKRKNSEYSINMKDDLQNSFNETVKRRRYSDLKDDNSKLNDEFTKKSNRQSITEERKYSLFVTNSPGEWSSQEIIDFVINECGVNETKFNDNQEADTKKDFQVKLQFDTQQQLNFVFKKCKEKEAEGKLTVHLEDKKDESDSDAESEKTLHIDLGGPSKQVQDLESDIHNFHIKEKYLKSLGIEPPVTNWVIVRNFRCDKSELKEVLELAGKVVVCSVLAINHKHANVMYSHPLEAIQAISMLNGQELYGNKLKITMDNKAYDNTLLPKGLANIGPGLGKYGKVLRDLADQYKKLIKGKPSVLEANLFRSNFLKTIGVTVDPESAKFDRTVPTPSSQSSKSESSENDNSESPSEKRDLQKQKQLGAIGTQLPNFNNPTGSNAPFNGPQIHNRPITNNNSSNICASPIYPGGPGITPRPILPAVRGPMLGPIGPVQRPMVGLSGAGYRGQTTSVFSNCPPIPGLELSSDPKNLHRNSGITPGAMIGPRPAPMQVLGGPMAGPRGPASGPMGPALGPLGPMTVPNRFSAPVSPMLGPRLGPNVSTLGPVPGPIPAPMGPARPMQPFNVNVQMAKGVDPVTIEIRNLPPSTNFVNLCQKLSELGHVVFLEFTTPGCAKVRFASPADAERCFQNYRKIFG